ncbi:Pentatricopeptide repeat-containing protein, mitochondrial, partial [Glycine soja]
LLATLTVASVKLLVNGQVSTSCTTSMMSSFTPCANIITGSTNNGLVPPSTCCDSLRSLMSTNMDCACLVISANAPFFQQPISQALALSLSQACSINGVPLQCKASGSPLPVPALVHVINACISLGWLDQAHDLLEEMRLAGVRTGSSVYSSLLKAYCRANRAADVTSLLRDAKIAGIQLDSSSYEAMIQSRVLQQDTQGALQLFKERKEARIPKVTQQNSGLMAKSGTETDEAGLVTKLLQEIKEGQSVDCGVHDWNNVIHFFCKKRLMQDAEKALKKMRSLGHLPNAQTFHSMVTGYAAIGGNYQEVTELSGEMKALASSISMKFDQELLDSVLYTFVRGGFFTRANEVVTMMEKGKMFVDKYKYRMLFLKYHKSLYKGKAPKFQTESQLNKREAALAFKRWIGLN